MMKFIKFINRINLSHLRRYAVISGILLIIILILDLHRYGAWYTGNQCFMRPYGPGLIITTGLPFFVYVIAGAVQFALDREWFMMIYLLRIFVFCLPFGVFNEYTLKYVFTKDIWYEKFIFRPVDLYFCIGIASMTGVAAGITLSLWILGQVYRIVNSIPLLRRILRVIFPGS